MMMNRKHSTRLSALLLAVGAAAWPAFERLAGAASWPAFRRDAARTAYVGEVASPPLTLRWTFAAEGAVVSSPVVAYERVYVGSRGNAFYCLDAYTGEVLWRFSTAGWVDGTAAVSGGRVFVPSRDGNIHCLDALTGAERWRYPTESALLGSPVVSGSEVYIAAGYPVKKLLVLDALSGKRLREAELTQFTASSPVLDEAGGRVFVGTNDGRYAAYKTDMTPLWSAGPTRGRVFHATPALAGGRLVAVPGDDDWTAHAFNPSNGAEAWVSTFVAAETSQATSVAASSDTVYFGSGSAGHRLYAVTLSSGGIRWSVPLGAASVEGLASSPAAALDIIYALKPSGELWAVHSGTGAVLARHALSGEGLSSPAVANGWVYAADMSGKVFGFEAGRALAVQAPDAAFDVLSGTVEIRGTAASPAFTGYRVEIASGAAPSSWTLLAESTSQVRRGTLAVLDPKDFTDGAYALRLTMEEAPATGLANQASYAFTYSLVKTAAVDAVSGGTLTLDDGTEIEIPPGALAGADTLSVRKLSSAGGTAPQGIQATGIIRDIRLASARKPVFLKPVSIKIPYAAYVPRKEENLRMYWLDEVSGRWEPVNTSRVLKGQKRVAAELDHFTLFAVMEYVPSGTLLEEADVYTYPNPARGHTLTFKFRLGDTADVTVRVYDVAGQLVAERARAGVLGGTVATLDWDISGRATGVYVYVLEARSAGGTVEKVKKKLAIIH